MKSRVTVLNQGAVLIRRRAGGPVDSSEDEEDASEPQNGRQEATEEVPPAPTRDPLEVSGQVIFSCFLNML
jgi:hypothetical protein